MARHPIDRRPGWASRHLLRPENAPGNGLGPGVSPARNCRFALPSGAKREEPGQTIWEVARGRGLKIPHLCHRPAPGYRPDGNCRACMVEIEGERTLAASCIPTARGRNRRAGWSWSS